MTISKKLALGISFALGAQFAAQAFTAASLKTEIGQILDFQQELSKQNTPQAAKTAKWLKKEMKSDYNSCLTDIDVIAIAKTISSNATVDAKLADLSQIMAEKAKENAARVEDHLKWEKKFTEEQKNEQISVLEKNLAWSYKLGKIDAGIIMGLCAILYVVTQCTDIITPVIARILKSHDQSLINQLQQMINDSKKAQK